MAACSDDAPKGQVLARVGDEAITRLDFDAELAADPGAAVGRPPLRAQILDRLIDRALLAQAARRQKLQLTPEYLAAARRGDDDVLIAQLRRYAAGEVRDPSPQELDAFIAAHPWMFAGRQQLVIDQIVRSGPTAVPRLPDMESIAGFLGDSGTPFQRSTMMIDSGSLPDADARLLTTAPEQVPQVTGTGGNARIVAVVSRAPVPLEGDLARQVARSVIRRELADRALDKLLAAERARTEVRYRPDLSPAAR